MGKYTLTNNQNLSLKSYWTAFDTKYSEAYSVSLSEEQINDIAFALIETFFATSIYNDILVRSCIDSDDKVIHALRISKAIMLRDKLELKELKGLSNQALADLCEFLSYLKEFNLALGLIMPKLFDTSTIDTEKLKKVIAFLISADFLETASKGTIKFEPLTRPDVIELIIAINELLPKDNCGFVPGDYDELIEQLLDDPWLLHKLPNAIDSATQMAKQILTEGFDIGFTTLLSAKITKICFWLLIRADELS